MGMSAKTLRSFGFYGIDVDVTHDDDALQVGAVPLVVVVAYVLVGEVVDDVDGADGHAVGILVAGVDDGGEVGVDAHDSAVPAAPFFADDAAFLVDFVVLQQDAVGPVV